MDVVNPKSSLCIGHYGSETKKSNKNMFCSACYLSSYDHICPLKDLVKKNHFSFLTFFHRRKGTRGFPCTKTAIDVRDIF